MEFELSKYQQEIKDYYLSHPKENILIEAYAGCAKTTMNKILLEESKTNDVYIAFNNSVADEFREKIKNPKVKVYTCHSLGYAIMNCNLSNNTDVKKGSFGAARTDISDKVEKKANLNNLKMYKVFGEMVKDKYGGARGDKEKQSAFRKEYIALYNLIRSTETVINEPNVGRIVSEYGLFSPLLGDWKMPETKEITAFLKRGEKEDWRIFDERKEVDFGDMLYITVKKLQDGEWKVPYWMLFTNICVDEVQDQNNLQLSLLPFIKRPGGRFVFTGDYHQSAYLFNGANSRAFFDIQERFAPIKKMTLPINYRCPKNHLQMVNDKFKIPIKPMPNAPEGEIKTIAKEEIYKYVKPGDMVISRKNKWLPEVVRQCANHGVPIHFNDQEMVNEIIKMLEPYGDRALLAVKRDIGEDIARYVSSQKELLKKAEESIMAPAKNSLADTEMDEYDYNEVELSDEKVMEILTNAGQFDNINFVLGMIDFYLSKNKMATAKQFSTYVTKTLCAPVGSESVRITSVHKAKGLEAPNVFVLNEGKICTVYGQTPEQQQQEENLSYISYTRAKNTLYLVKENKSQNKNQKNDKNKNENKEG